MGINYPVSAPPPRRGIISVRADGSAGGTASIAERLAEAFEAFKAENDARLADLRKGINDPIRDQKIDRIGADISKFQEALERNIDAVAALQVGAGGSAAPGVRDPEHTKAFRSWFSRGVESAKLLEVNASLDKGVATEGGFLAPTEWDRTLTDKLVLISPFRQIATVQQIGVGAFSKLFNQRGTGSGWVGETATRPETAGPAFASMPYAIGELYANPFATQQLLDDAQINVETWLAGEIETEFSFQENVAFISGNGTNKPNGILTYVTGAANAAAHPFGAIPVNTAVGTTAVTTDEVVSLVYGVQSIFLNDARFLMNRSVQGTIRKLKDGMGNYIWQPTFTAGQPASLLGYPITEMPAMPNMTTGAIPILFGDIRRGYVVLDRVGLRVLRDPYTNKPYVGFYTTKRVGGGLLNPQPLIALKMA
jgi:HK97 family phage major capsid protein